MAWNFPNDLIDPSFHSSTTHPFDSTSEIISWITNFSLHHYHPWPSLSWPLQLSPSWILISTLAPQIVRMSSAGEKKKIEIPSHTGLKEISLRKKANKRAHLGASSLRLITVTGDPGSFHPLAHPCLVYWLPSRAANLMSEWWLQKQKGIVFPVHSYKWGCLSQKSPVISLPSKFNGRVWFTCLLWNQ